jgi:hypothetical protein
MSNVKGTKMKRFVESLVLSLTTESISNERLRSLKGRKRFVCDGGGAGDVATLTAASQGWWWSGLRDGRQPGGAEAVEQAG